jgi:hypothetical protein
VFSSNGATATATTTVAARRRTDGSEGKNRRAGGFAGMSESVRAVVMKPEVMGAGGGMAVRSL